jgi:hypothetical protein
LKKPEKIDSGELIKKLKDENKKLVSQNKGIRDMLSLVVKTWRDSDSKSAEICYDVCRKATCLFLDIGTNIKK